MNLAKVVTEAFVNQVGEYVYKSPNSRCRQTEADASLIPAAERQTRWTHAKAL